MPVVDYSKTLIYKIQHQTKDELLYVGSTTHFGNRKSHHKGNCYNPNGKSYNYKLYQTIRDNGGWDAFNMVIVKEFPCENKRQAEAEEDKCIREMKSSLNMRKAFTTPEEKLEHNREYRVKNKNKIKEYLEKNKDKIKERSKEHYEQNKDKHRELAKEYYLQNKDKNSEYQKKYKLKNREKIKEQTKCECGCMIRKYGLPRHKLSKKHQTFINQQTDQ